MSQSKLFAEEAILPDKDHYSSEEIDMIPVTYCQDCLSLAIKRNSGGVESCESCWSTNMEMARTIFEWEKLYKQRYERK